jgi:methanogenic corrinoid protein MtbC1
MEIVMETQSQTNPRQQPRHSIAVVSRRTGISQLVLRAWERRYRAVNPGRTPTGRRKYSDADLEKLALLANLTGAGHRIGDIASLSVSDLQQLVRENAAAGVAPVPATTVPQAEAGQLMEEALRAVADLDSRGLEKTLDRALVDLSKPDLRRKLLVPLLVEIGERWKDGKLRVAHEHMATSIVLAFLTALNARYQVAPGAPVVAVATPSGQMHELGALLASAHAYEAGWDVLYLGPNLPAEDIAAAVRSRGARAILLSLVFPHGDSHTTNELRELRHLLGDDVQILAGGQAAESYGEVLAEVGARVFLDLDQLDSALIL